MRSINTRDTSIWLRVESRSAARVRHKSVFLSSVTAFAELVHKTRYHCEPTMGAERGRGGQGPLDFENLAKQGCFLSLRREETDFTTFGPLRKILKKSPCGPSLEKSFRRP